MLNVSLAFPDDAGQMGEDVGMGVGGGDHEDGGEPFLPLEDGEGMEQEPEEHIERHQVRPPHQPSTTTTNHHHPTNRFPHSDIPLSTNTLSWVSTINLYQCNKINTLI